MFMIMQSKANEEKTISINKIKKYNSLYQLTFSNNKVLLCDENSMFEYSLYLNKKIDESVIELLENKQEIYEIQDKALKIINYKAYTSKQVRDKLLSQGFEGRNIDEVIENFIRLNFLNDELYYEDYLRFKINQGYGPLYIKNKLYELGIDKDVYIEKDVQYEIIKNKMDKLKINKDIKILKKNFRNKMIQQGFEISIIDNVLLEMVVEKDNTYLKIDYDKLLKAYQKKYEDENKLYYMIKNKLYKKGYDISDIDDVMKGLI